MPATGFDDKMNLPPSSKNCSRYHKKIISAVEILAVLVLTVGLLLIFSKSTFQNKYSGYRQSIALTIWIYIPTLVLLLHKRKFKEYGITLKGWKTSLRAAGIISIITLLPYIIIFGAFEVLVNSANLHIAISDAFLTKAVSLLLFVSLPEEYFFRGYLQTEFNRLFGKPYFLLGVNFGLGLILSAIIFGLVHALFRNSWSGLLTILSALLFGWLREMTGGILAPTLYHGLGNIVYITMVESFY